MLTQPLLELEKFPDNPSVPFVPAATTDVFNVDTVVPRRRNEENTAFPAVTVDATREVDRSRTEHDGGVRQRRVPRAGGGSTQAGDDAPNDRVSGSSYRDKLRRNAERLRRRNYDPGIDRSAGKYDGHRRKAYDIEVSVGSTVVVE